VYVRDFAPERVPAVGSVRIRVSTNDGDKPRWRRDGTELYYIAPDRRLMAVAVRSKPTFDVGPPITLFDVRLTTTNFPYDVASDDRFLVNTLGRALADTPAGMTVVLNWAAR
jgi:hypothetical protein